MRVTAGRARRWARSLRNASVSVQEDAVDDVQCPQAPIALPVDNDLLVLLEFPREQSHVAGLCGPGHCAVELAMREDRLVQIDANALTESLSLALVDRHGPGQSDGELVPPQSKREARVPSGIAMAAWEVGCHAWGQ